MSAEWLIVCIFVVNKIKMNECFGRKFVINGELETSENFDASLVYEGESVYEVIRVVKGSPEFFFDHMERLSSSVRMQNKKMLADQKTLKTDIINLLRTDKKKDTNLKIVFNYNKDSQTYLVYFIESMYPSDNQYSKGVKGILFYAERKDPESKVINQKLRSSIYHKLILDEAYEALLVNDKGQITEGSRSNIFFLRKDTLVTAPHNMVLSGITRKYILQICAENNIKVSMECVTSDTISEYDAVFMTGTSPRVLPFNSIDDINFKVKFPLIENLRKSYVMKADESIARFRTGIV
jgi:branched-chain amino acid aminotransferase